MDHTNMYGMICPFPPPLPSSVLNLFEGWYFILLWAVMYTAEMTVKLYLTGLVCTVYVLPPHLLLTP